MFYAEITRKFPQGIETEEYQDESSIDVGNKVAEWLGEMITVWQGDWDIKSMDCGHIELSASQVKGHRGGEFPVSFTINSC